jgi:hypothetical protein
MKRQMEGMLSKDKITNQTRFKYCTVVVTFHKKFILNTMERQISDLKGHFIRNTKTIGKKQIQMRTK